MKYLLFIVLVLISCKKTSLSSSLKASSGSSCTDTPPDERYTCAEQVGWGKCGKSWMKGYCELSCGKCSESKADIPRILKVSLNSL